MESIGLTDLVDTLKAYTYRPKRNPEGPFIFSVDHCFSIRGQGTVMTGTVLSGKAVVNDVRVTYLKQIVTSTKNSRTRPSVTKMEWLPIFDVLFHTFPVYIRVVVVVIV